jgi:O-antigen/teichoic acid export membrane protein
MGSEFFGLWSLLWAITQFANIGTLGISSIVNKFSSEINCTDAETSCIISSALLIVLPMAVLALLILLGFRNILVDNIKPSFTYLNQFKTALMICTFSIIPQFINKIFQGYFLSQIKNRFVRTMEFISSTFPLMGGVIISIFVKNLVWLSIWNLLVQITILCVFIITTARSFIWRWSPKVITLKRMLRFSAFMFLASSANTFFQQFDRILVGMILGSVAAGVYSVGTGVGSRLAIISGQTTETMIPYSSLKNSLGEYEKLYKIFRKLSEYLSLIIAGSASLCIIWMREILSLWISPEYASSYYLLFCVLILAYGFLSLSRPADQTLIGLGHVQLTSLTYLLASTAMITSLYFLSQKFGLFGAASANLVMVLLLIMNLFAYKVINKKIQWIHVFEDLKWGIVLPSLAYLMILFHASWYLKLSFSLLMGIFALIIIKKDTFIKTQLGQITQRLPNKKEASH